MDHFVVNTGSYSKLLLLLVKYSSGKKNAVRTALLIVPEEYLIAIMAASVYDRVEEVNGFEAWLKSVSDDYQKLATFQRLVVLSRLVKLCSPSELYEYSNYVTELLRRDFISSLPAELADRVISYVDYKSLLCACCVSITPYMKQTCCQLFWN